ncbi:MAG: 2-succinylbenzoate--CoA ligase [Leptolyngbya sp. SIO4C5]|nr:2-succinylbenzoate--CoA ligase [Leptolyngbya sp. SIO4C5]
MAEFVSAAALLQQRWGDDWLIGADSQRFWQAVEARSQQVTQLRQPQILLAEADPVLFLAGFMAACRCEATLFLANPDWQAQEWQQVAQQVGPVQVWGRSPIAAAQQPSLPMTQIGFRVCIPTGGSSGRIKFAVHTWETLWQAVQGFQQHFQIATVSTYCTLPLYHVSGLMQALRSFISGGRLVVQPFKSLEQGNRLLTNPDDCFISLVPTQLQRLLNTGEVVADWLRRFQAVLLGGAPAWPQLLAQTRQQQIPLALTYGMTETAAQIATLLPAEFFAGNTSSGRLLPHARIEILGKTGSSLPAGQVGQIAIQARSLHLGYYPHFSSSNSQPESLSFRPDDLGFLDAAGYLHIVGRHSDKIISGGEKVFPAEVEATIRATGLVQDLCVIGLADPDWGQAVTAVYVPTQASVSAAEIKRAIASQLTAYKHPKRWIAVSRLPRSAQGKLNRQEVISIAQR